MRCNINIEDLIKYMEKSLSDEESRRIEEHLRSCEKCRRNFGVLSYTEAYGKDVLGNNNIKDKVMEGIDMGRYSKNNKKKANKAMNYIKPLAGVAAALVMVVFGVITYNNFFGKNPPGPIVTNPENTPTSAPVVTSTPLEQKEKKNILVYFGNSNADGVMGEQREIEIIKGETLEKYVFEELAKGPQSKDLSGTIPAGTKLLSVSTSNGICTIDLSSEFVTNSPGGSAGETMAVYSIVNSLTELPGIDKVQFLINGNKESSYIHLVFDEPFSRNEEMIKSGNNSDNGGGNQGDVKSIVEQRGNAVANALKEKNMQTLSTFVHPVKGLLFSPYSNIDTQNDKVFTSAQVPGLMQDNTVYNWGSFDGSGDPINYTFSQYYDKFVYGKDFVNAEQKGYNEILIPGNIVVNIEEVYPQGNFVDYSFSGFNPEYGGLDWESLRLVFEEYNGIWYLVAIAHGQWTI